MTNFLPENIPGLRIVPGAHWRRIPISSWQTRYARKEHCMICHPSPVPPFPDCPHGHYRNPWRLEQQLRYIFRHEFPFYTLAWLISCVFLAGGLVVWMISTAMYLLYLFGYFFHRWVLRRTARNLYRMGVGYDDPYSPLWEKRKRWNEPWNKVLWP